MSKKKKAINKLNGGHIAQYKLTFLSFRNSKRYKK